MTQDTKPALRLYDTLHRRQETFVPMDPPRVGVYACGPTVYDVPHIGNYRTFVWVDVLHRTLRWLGYDVRLVMNITDVDDNTIEGARRAEEPLATFTERHTRTFLQGLDRLGALPASVYPRATAHISEMIVLVETLLQKGNAYVSDGSVFFRVASFPHYGRLARLDPEELRSTERVAGDEYVKEDPRDFALWKAAKPGEPSWPAPFGAGRPGWHLECSTMSMEYLGETFDIHAGGVDLVFPHHENEIAQSEAATGKPFARTWLHCSHLVVEGTKMSKSLGNFYTLADLLEAGHAPVAIRYLLASVHYRRQLNFTFDALGQAAASVQRLRDLVVRLEQEREDLPPDGGTAGSTDALGRAREGFAASLTDDLNTAGALGHLFTLVREANTALDEGALSRPGADAILAWIREVDTIFSILPERLREIEIEVGDTTMTAVGPPLEPALEERIAARARARARGDFATADRLRDELRRHGVEVEDTARGVRWKRLPDGAAGRD